MEPLEPRRRSDELTASEAAQWHVRSGQLDNSEREAFAAWLKESPRHVREFLLMETLGEQLKCIDPQRRQDVQALLAEASNEVVPLRVGDESFGATNAFRHERKQRRLAATVAVAASLLIAIAATWFWLPSIRGWQDFTTAIGEQRTIRLADDSLVNLNTGSRLRVRFTDSGRDLQLLEGEALFKVHQDPARPFRVHTRDAVIQAIGTQFNVRRRTNDTSVAVIEGRVRVAPEGHSSQPTSGAGVSAETRPSIATHVTALSAGEEANVTRSSGVVRKQPTPDTSSAIAWQQRRLVFREDSLADIVAEFNRYNRTPKIELDGLEGIAQHYTGTFDADNPRSLAALLSTQSDLAVMITDERIIIRPR